MDPLVYQEKKQERQRNITTLFDLGLVVKAFTGTAETLAALFVAFTPKTFILTIANIVTSGELSNDPEDPISNTIREAAHSFSIHSHTLLIAYLLLHGVVKLALVAGIFTGKRIAYPLFIVALIFFSSYEAYRGIVRTDYLLMAFATLDFALIFITAYQYRVLEQADGKA